MGFLYFYPTGMKYFQRLEFIFRHSDLIGNGEFWFGGLISLSIILLIIYNFWFGTVFVRQYPTETSNSAYFSCDSTLQNTDFSSTLQLVTTIKSNNEERIFNMLDSQEITMIVKFLQTGYTCADVTEQVNETCLIK